MIFQILKGICFDHMIANSYRLSTCTHLNAKKSGQSDLQMVQLHSGGAEQNID